SRIAACTLALSSGVTSRIPCCFACSAAFFSTSSSVVPLITCVHPDDGSTLAHSTILPMVVLLVEPRICANLRQLVKTSKERKEQILRKFEKRVNGTTPSFHSGGIYRGMRGDPAMRGGELLQAGLPRAAKWFPTSLFPYSSQCRNTR